MIEIRWHGRGGQGAKTASHLLAAAALNAGRWVQAFPEYGPERSGAPVRAYDRLDGRPVRRRASVTRPDVVVVLDDTLLEEVDVTVGLRPGGVLVVNSAADTGELRRRTGFAGGVLAVPGADIAARAGAGRANVVLLGALAGVLGEPPVSAVRAAVRDALAEKLDAGALEGACTAMEAGYRTAAAAGVSPRIPDGPGGGEAEAWLGPDGGGSQALESFQALRAGAVVEPGMRPRPVTGAWREGSRPEVDAYRCIDCLLCWVYCPDAAILVEADHLTGFDFTLCKGCALCVEVCPVDAIAMVPDTAPMRVQAVGGGT